MIDDGKCSRTSRVDRLKVRDVRELALVDKLSDKWKLLSEDDDWAEIVNQQQLIRKYIKMYTDGSITADIAAIGYDLIKVNTEMINLMNQKHKERLGRCKDSLGRIKDLAKSCNLKGKKRKKLRKRIINLIIVKRAVRVGITYGYGMAYSYTPSPSGEEIKRNVCSSIMIELEDVIKGLIKEGV
jgi:hypothetical protein